VITGPCSVTIGQWNVNRGHRNVIMRPWHVNRDRGMRISDCAM
jgi:hypothetical protein